MPHPVVTSVGDRILTLGLAVSAFTAPAAAVGPERGADGTRCRHGAPVQVGTDLVGQACGRRVIEVMLAEPVGGQDVGSLE